MASGMVEGARASVELQRLGVLGGVGSDVGTVNAAEVLGRASRRGFMSPNAGDIVCYEGGGSEEGIAGVVAQTQCEERSKKLSVLPR